MSDVIEDLPKWIDRIKDSLLESSHGGHVESYRIDEAIDFLNYLELDDIPDPIVDVQCGDMIRLLFSGTGKGMTITMVGDLKVHVLIEMGMNRRVTVDQSCGVAGFREMLANFYPTTKIRLNGR